MGNSRVSRGEILVLFIIYLIQILFLMEWIDEGISGPLKTPMSVEFSEVPSLISMKS